MKSFKTLFTAGLAATALSAAAWAQPAAPQAPSEVIYLPQLPTAADLSRAAAAQGQTVTRIEQGNGGVTASYTNASGQTMVVSYQLLPNGASVAPGAPPPPATGGPAPAYGQDQNQVVVTQPTSPAPTVVYNDASAYNPYAYDYYPAYGYSPWYPAIGLGIGWGWGYNYGWGGYRYGWGHGGWGHPYYGRAGVGFHGGTAYRGGFRGGAGFHGGGGNHR